MMTPSGQEDTSNSVIQKVASPQANQGHEQQQQQPQQNFQRTSSTTPSSLLAPTTISSSSSSPLAMLKPNSSPQLSSINLTKALAKPPPLSSILTLPKNALLLNTANTNSHIQSANGASVSSNASSLSSSPSLFAQQQSLPQTKISNTPEANHLSLSSSSLSFQNADKPNTSNHFSNSMPAATTAQLFSNSNNQQTLFQQSTPQLSNTSRQQPQQPLTQNQTFSLQNSSTQLGDHHNRVAISSSNASTLSSHFLTHPQQSIQK